MITIYVYNPQINAFERHYRALHSAMPYAELLSIEEFRGNSCSNVLWTDMRTMEAWREFRGGWGKPIPFGHAFKRIWEGGHGLQSQHYAGMAFDVGQKYSKEEQAALRNYAIQSGLWDNVEPVNISPSWVHVDKRAGSSGAGYPMQCVGSLGVYVFVLQDALNALGYRVGLDGTFGAGTKNALQRFQSESGLDTSGIADCATWSRLIEKARGVGEIT